MLKGYDQLELARDLVVNAGSNPKHLDASLETSSSKPVSRVLALGPMSRGKQFCPFSTISGEES